MNERQILKEALGSTPACPPANSLSSPSEAIQEHLHQCPRCRSEVRLLEAYESAAIGPEELAGQSWLEAELMRRSAEITEAAPRVVAPSRVRAKRWSIPLWNWRAISMAAA